MQRRGNELRHPTVVVDWKISEKTWRTASRSIRLRLRERLRKARRTSTTLWQFAGFLTGLTHSASQPKPATPDRRVLLPVISLGEGSLRIGGSRAAPNDPPHPLSDRSHKLASTTLAFDQPVTDRFDVIVYGPQAPPNKI
jgi:hypothetical protein